MPSAGRSPCPELFKFSSNIASAKMAVEMGTETQRAFFDKIGFLKPLNTQLTELAAPLYPRHWMKINTMTIAFGHGMSVTPLHLVTGAAAVVNGGTLYAPSLVKRTAASDPGRRIIQAKTSVMMRQLLRLNVVDGTGKKADLPGYEVGGKTGTAEKAARGGYRQKALISSFVGMFPMNDPKFVIIVFARRAQGHRRNRRLRHRRHGGRAQRQDAGREHRIALRHPAGRPEGGTAADRDRLDSAAGTSAARSSCRRTHAIACRTSARPCRCGPASNQTAAAPATGVRRVAAE